MSRKHIRGQTFEEVVDYVESAGEETEMIDDLVVWQAGEWVVVYNSNGAQLAIYGSKVLARED